MEILVKIIICIFIISSYVYAQAYTFLVNKYDKEIELESKIMFNISKSLLAKKIILFIPNITEIEKEIYKKRFQLAKTCKESNFIFVKRHVKKEDICMNEKKIYFTNNYKKLLSNNIYLGAFFWNKSRPNIVFLKKRLDAKRIKLPSSYTQFIENI